MKPLVYLAGPIAGTAPGEAIEWRQAAAAALRDRGIETLSPMRAKSAIAHAPGGIGRDFRDYENEGAFYTSRGIMARDFNDVKRCDALLVNLLDCPGLSFGTAMELAWAWQMQKPAVVAIPAGHPYLSHPMLFEAMPFRLEALEDAIVAVAVVLGR